ncbi:hypothetical protein [Tomitella fengzijianii]|uniref:Uncharacterized protein n=1 Tax=Tomitella fengzijianii TaxID=2597660 RepID=A0A516X1X8_9ACTN|nr:hypothetical protein [Tomitella fengzijianii]QDQ97020.1 hypothetical protein FO059_06315 [Tomitella fengzijianii]
MTEPDRGTDRPSGRSVDPDSGAAATGVAAPSPGAQTGRHRLALKLGGAFAGAGIVVAAVFGALYETGTAPFDDAGQAPDGAIAAATQTWVEAMNSQNVEQMRASVCAGDQAKFASTQDKPPVSEPVRVDSVHDVVVSGATATATLTASVGAGGNKQTQDFQLGYKDEAGTWKVCQSAGTAQAPK